MYFNLNFNVDMRYNMNLSSLSLYIWIFSFGDFTGAQSKAAYNGLMAKMELFNKLLCFLMCFGATNSFLTIASYSFVRYFIFDMGADSFYLFAPSWFVLISHETTFFIIL